MAIEILTWWFILRGFLRRNNGWIGELAVSIFTTLFAVASIVNHGKFPLMQSVEVLSKTIPTKIIYLSQFSFSIMSLLAILVMPLMPRMAILVRTLASTGLFCLWLAFPWGLWINSPGHPLVYLYLAFPFLSAYAVIALANQEF